MPQITLYVTQVLGSRKEIDSIHCMMDLLLLVLLLLLVSQAVLEKQRMKCPLSFEIRDGEKPWNYYRPGDHLIATVSTETMALPRKLPFNMAPSSESRSTGLYLKLLSLAFAIQTVNKNPQLLPNRTLGYTMHDNYFSTLSTSDALLDMLSTGQANVPNYSCGRKENLLAVFDGAMSETTTQMSTLLGAYKVPQISDAFVSEAQNDKSQFPFFHRMLPTKGITYPSILQLLLHFRWTLIGLITSDTDEGQNFMRTFTPVLLRNGICVVITQQFSATGYTAPLGDALSKWRQANVFINYIENINIWDRIRIFQFKFESMPGPIEGKIWIMGAIDYLLSRREDLYKYAHSIWSFAFQKKSRSEDDVVGTKLSVKLEDRYFHCSFSKHILSVKGRKRCTQKAPLEPTPENRRMWITFHLRLHSIIKTLAHALKAAYSSRSRRRIKKGDESVEASGLQPWQMLYSSHMADFQHLMWTFLCQDNFFSMDHHILPT